MCGAAPRQAFEQRLDGNEDERQQDALRLGEVERALERGLRHALVAELLAGHRVEQLRLGDRGWPVKHRGGTIEHPGEHVDRAFGLTFCKMDDGGGHAHIAAVAFLPR